MALGDVLERCRAIIAAFPIPQSALCLFNADTVVFLRFSGLLIPAAGDNSPLIIGDLAPFHFCLAAELYPPAFDAIPIHVFGLLGYCPAAYPLQPLSSGMAWILLAAAGRRSRSRTGFDVSSGLHIPHAHGNNSA